MAKHSFRLDDTEPFEFTGFGVEGGETDAGWGVVWEDSCGIGVRVCIAPGAISEMLRRLFEGFDDPIEQPNAEMRAAMAALVDTMEKCLASYTEAER